MSNGMSRNPEKVAEHLGGLQREVDQHMQDYPAPKTRDGCILTAFKEMTGKSITVHDLELLKHLIAHGARR